MNIWSEELVKKTMFHFAATRKTLKPVEIYVTLDGSSNTGAEAFNQTKNFLMHVLNNYDYGPHTMRMLIVVYTGTVRTYEVTSVEQASTVAHAIDAISYPAASPNVLLLVTKLATIVTSFARARTPAATLLVGGFEPQTSEMATIIILMRELMKMPVKFHYFPIGAKTGGKFWNMVIPFENTHRALELETLWIENLLTGFTNTPITEAMQSPFADRK